MSSPRVPPLLDELLRAPDGTEPAQPLYATELDSFAEIDAVVAVD